MSVPCGYCSAMVEYYFNDEKLRWEPISHYWKGDDPMIHPYCNPECSLADYSSKSALFICGSYNGAFRIMSPEEMLK